MQQSAAFKILKTRLKAVPLYSFNVEQSKRTPSGNPYQFLHHVPSGSQIREDGDITVDAGNSRNGINFAARLQQFEQMQNQHRLQSKVQAQSRQNSTSLSKVANLFILHVDFLFFIVQKRVSFGATV